MGLLDDAIREHLDLKRRRGADPLEVERAEREALGPVRRAPEGQPEPEFGPGAEFADEHLADEPLAADSWSHDVAGEPAEPGEEFDPLAHDEHEPSADASDAPLPHRAAQETAEYDVEEALDSEPEHPQAGDDDVLEETPEFLQDTPDHDRLWFEQRPPKDFDFDR